MSALQELIASFVESGGKVKTAPYGNAVRDNDGESWAHQSRRRWAVKQDKEQQR